MLFGGRGARLRVEALNKLCNRNARILKLLRALIGSKFCMFGARVVSNWVLPMRKLTLGNFWVDHKYFAQTNQVTRWESRLLVGRATTR